MLSTDGQFAARPFYAGALTGLRAFGVDPEGRLTGIFFQRAWESSQVTAECSYDAAARHRAATPPMSETALSMARAVEAMTRASGGNAEPHDVGSLGCTCGFYAYFDGRNDHLRQQPFAFTAQHRLAGIIQGYGVTTVGSRGFRAAKAHVVALVLPEGAFSRARILATYPDVAAYLTVEEALADHPLTVPEREEVAS